jgi:Uncharacterized protein conserved in bacteria (DUF2242)
MKVIHRSILPCCRSLAIAALAGALLGGCNSTKVPRSYQTEGFPSETPFQYYSSREPEEACEIAKRALLSQGYQVDESKPRNIRGEKYFRPKPDEATRLSIILVCLPSNLGTVIYASGLETQFEMKSKGSNAGVSVPALGSLSLPWSLDKDTLVKVGEETITDPEFYKRLFELIRMLDG